MLLGRVCAGSSSHPACTFPSAFMPMEKGVAVWHNTWRNVCSSHSQCLVLKSNYFWECGVADNCLIASLILGRCFFCCSLTFFLVLMQLTCYLKKKIKILFSVSGCYLHSREQISDNPKYAFVQFHSILCIMCHWLLTFLTNIWF